MEALKAQNDKLSHGDNFNIPQQRHVQQSQIQAAQLALQQQQAMANIIQPISILTQPTVNVMGRQLQPPQQNQPGISGPTTPNSLPDTVENQLSQLQQNINLKLQILQQQQQLANKVILLISQ
jgi:hypothetical protein